MMNTIDQKDGNTMGATGVSRRSLIMAGVASLVGCNTKPNDTIVAHVFSNMYSNMQQNFDKFFLNARQDQSKLWIQDGDNKKLTIQDEKIGTSYALQIQGDKLMISVKSKTEEMQFSYAFESGQIHGPKGKDIGDFSRHLSGLQSLLHEQGVSF